MAGARAPEPAEVHVASRAAWRRWLERHHARPEGIWLVYPNKASGTDLTYDALVEEALCFGWIDSTVRGRGDGHRMMRMSPRKPKSVWSKLNKTRIERLVAEGRMRPEGQARIDAAKADGSWTALDAVEALEVPPDLAKALRADAAGRRHFDAFSPSARKAYLYWIAGAKRPETRAARVAEVVRLAAANVRAR